MLKASLSDHNLRQDGWFAHLSCLIFMTLGLPAGWGERDLLIAAAAVCGVLFVAHLAQQRQWIKLCFFVPLVVLGLTWTEALLLYAYWGLYFAVLATSLAPPNPIVMLSVGMFLLSSVNYFDVLARFFTPTLLVLAGLAAATVCWLARRFLTGSRSQRLAFASAVVSACFTMPDVLSTPRGLLPSTFPAGPNRSISFGKTASAIAGQHSDSIQLDLPDGSAPAPLHTGKLSSDGHRIVLLEHGSSSPFYGGVDLQQALPWGGHVFFGNQYLAAAIERDGVLASNLGGSLSSKAGCPVLLSCSCRGKRAAYALISRKRGVAVISDSDVLTDKLSAYNPSLIKELTGNNKLVRYAVAAMSLGSLPFFVTCRDIWKAVGLAVAIGTCMIGRGPTTGTVRLCCDTGSPHDDSGSYGVLRVMNDSGIIATRGDRDCSVLCVGPGRHAIHAGEKLVLLEPLASCNLGGKIIKCENMPLGNLPQVPNAMSVIVDKKQYLGTFVIDGVRVIGTGSPAKQHFDKWLLTSP
jgi:hypothetical protein